MIQEVGYCNSARTVDNDTLSHKKILTPEDHLKLPNCCCWKLSVPPVDPVDDREPDLPCMPDPVPIVVAVHHGTAEPLSSDPSLNFPTTPTSERSTFFAACND